MTLEGSHLIVKLCSVSANDDLIHICRTTLNFSQDKYLNWSDIFRTKYFMLPILTSGVDKEKRGENITLVNTSILANNRYHIISYLNREYSYLVNHSKIGVQRITFNCSCFSLLALTNSIFYAALI